MNNNEVQFKCVFRYSLVQCLYYYCGALSISLNGSSDGRDVSTLATPEEMSDSDEESAEVDDK